MAKDQPGTAYMVQVKVRGKWETMPGRFSAAGYGSQEAARKAAEAEVEHYQARGFKAQYIVR